MRLFVDDLRIAPEGWQPVRTITEAIGLLATGHVKEISLDHDIMIPDYSDPNSFVVAAKFSDETFMPIAYYLALMPEKPRVLFHSGNIEMARRMSEIVGVHFDYWWPEDAREIV